MQKPFLSVLVAFIVLCFFGSCNDHKKIDYKTATSWCNDFKKKFPHPMSGKMDSASIVKAHLEKDPFCYSFFVSKDIYNQVKGNNPNVMLFMGMSNDERCFVLVPADGNWQPIADSTRPIYCMYNDNGLCPRICDNTAAISSSSRAAKFVGYADVKNAIDGFLNGEGNQPNVICLVDSSVNPILEKDPYMRLAFASDNDNHNNIMVGFGVTQDGQDDQQTFRVIGSSDIIRKSLPDPSAAGHHH